jgi:hypothetical protein
VRVFFIPSTQRNYRRLILLRVLLHASVVRTSRTGTRRAQCRGGITGSPCSWGIFTYGDLALQVGGV